MDNSRRHFDLDPGFQTPPGTNQSSPFRSFQSLNEPESPSFETPRSSPVREIHSVDDPSENAPLLTREDHYSEITSYGTGGEIERSRSLVFPGSSVSFEREDMPLWKCIRQVRKKMELYSVPMITPDFYRRCGYMAGNRSRFSKR